jgi:hypothetical protein
LEFIHKNVRKPFGDQTGNALTVGRVRKNLRRKVMRVTMREESPFPYLALSGQRAGYILGSENQRTTVGSGICKDWGIALLALKSDPECRNLARARIPLRDPGWKALVFLF